MATNYGHNSAYGRYNLPDKGDRYVDEFGREFYWTPQGINPFHGGRGTYKFVQHLPGYGAGDSLSLNRSGTSAGVGTGGMKLPGWASAAISGGPQGFNSQYESQLAALLGKQAPGPQANPATQRLMDIATQLQNFVPASQLPASLQAALDRMKAQGLAGVEESATRGASQLAGHLYDTTGGGSGTASDFLKAELAKEVGSARGQVESNYAQAFLQELDRYNQSRLAALQGAASPLGAAGQLGESDINRRYQSFYDDIGSRSSILSRLLQAEKERQPQNFDYALQLLNQGFEY